MNQTVCCRVSRSVFPTEVGHVDGSGQMVAKCDRLLPDVLANNHVRLWVAFGAGRLAIVSGEPEDVVRRLAPREEACENANPVYLGRRAVRCGPALVQVGDAEQGLSTLARAFRVAARRAVAPMNAGARMVAAT